MSWLSRIQKITSAVGGSMETAVGFTKDVVTAPFTSDGFDDMVHDLGDDAKRRFNEGLQRTVGPNGIGGATIGALPEIVRGPVRDTFSGLDRAYNDVVSHPLSTFIVAGNLATNRGDAQDPNAGFFGQAGNEWKQFFNRKTWSDAWKVGDGESPGQAFAYTLLGGNQDDPTSLQKVAGSDTFQVLSTTTDALSRLLLDPTVVAGKALGALHGLQIVTDASKLDEGAGFVDKLRNSAVVPKVVHNQDDIDKMVNSTKWADTNDWLEGKSAAEIQQRLFANNRSGGLVSHLYEQAPDADTRTQLTRIFLGDSNALRDIYTKNTALSNQVDRLLGKDQALAAAEQNAPSMGFGRFQVLNKQDERQKIQQEIDQVYAPELAQQSKLMSVAAGADQLPTLTTGGAIRTGITRSAFYQRNPIAAPLRTIIDMRPQHLLNLNDQRGFVQVKRMLTKSDLDQSQQDIFLGRYMGAMSDAERQQAYVEAESASTKSIMKTYGHDDGDIEKVLQLAHTGRGHAQEVLKSRAYDGAGRSLVRYTDDAGGTHEVQLPLMVSQNANVLPMADMDAVRDAAKSAMRKAYPSGVQNAIEGAKYAGALGDDILSSYYKLWRPATLLRGGWPVRVVGDEQMRIISQIGTLTQAKNLGHVAGEIGRAGLSGLKGFVKPGVEEEEARGRLQSALENMRNTYKPGERDVRIGAYTIPGAFSSPGDDANVYKTWISAKQAFDKMYGRDGQGFLDRLRNGKQDDDIVLPSGKHTGEHRSIAPTESDYAPAWEWAVNKQIGQDTAGRFMLQGKTNDEIIRWLRGGVLDGEKGGREYLKRISPARRVAKGETSDYRMNQWLTNLRAQVDAYTAGDDGLRAAALEGKAKSEDLAKVLPDASLRPAVHGPILKQDLGKGPMRDAVNGITNGLFKVLGQLPTDVLSRQPFFRTQYEREAERLINLLDDGKGIDGDMMEHIVSQSREKALGDTLDLLYDLHEESNLAHMLRHVSPFYMAWQEVLTRWAGITIENPAFMARAHLIWSSPEKAGIVYDENGNQVHGDGTATNPLTNEKVAPGQQRNIVVMLPKSLANVPGFKGIATENRVAINKKTFNIMLQGSPGFGPPVGLAANEIAKHNPDLESSVKWALPFGVRDTSQIIMPSAYQKLEASQDEDGRQFRNQTIRIFFDRVHEWQIQGEHGPKPTFEDAINDARSLGHLRIAASFLLPFAPTFQSPYQPYIDAYRNGKLAYANALKADPNAAPYGRHVDGTPKSTDEWFYETYGPEFFMFSQSLTKSMDGVPATVEGYRARGKEKDLIAEAPELGGWIIGNEGNGAFSNAVYQAQLGSKVGPGSTHNQRESASLEEQATQPDVRAGWLEYGKAMDIIDAEMHQRGLRSLNQHGAQDLLQLKKKVVNGVAKKYNAWYDDYQQSDPTKMQKRIVNMDRIANDPRMQGRKEMEGVRDYMKARKVVVNELAKRKAGGGSGSIQANKNADLARLWDRVTNGIVEGNVPFGATYHRWLENDVLQAE